MDQSVAIEFRTMFDEFVPVFVKARFCFRSQSMLLRLISNGEHPTQAATWRKGRENYLKSSIDLKRWTEVLNMSSS